MKQPLAAIDLGTHTARLLIATLTGKDTLPQLQPLLRERVFIRLAEGFHGSDQREILPSGFLRTLEALAAFRKRMESFHVKDVRAVATGIFRMASNAGTLLEAIRKETGLAVMPISGQQEALLTGQGVLSHLTSGQTPSVIFDLGGGTTEFIHGLPSAPQTASLPLGAAVLTGRFLHHDPPLPSEITLLLREAESRIEEAGLACVKAENGPVVGTGGTVTALGAMVHHIPCEAICPESLNGRTVTLHQLESLTAQMGGMNLEERLRLPGLDQNRAQVILAGSLAVVTILRHLQAEMVDVSLSDLLEGLILKRPEPEGGNPSTFEPMRFGTL